MSKIATFGDSKEDKELVKKIITYQKQKKYTSFIAAVRDLCNRALKLQEITQ